MNKEQALNNLKEIDEVIRSLNMEYVLAYGTLLGYHREKDFIKHDTDTDILMDSKYISKELFLNLEKKGFTAIRFFGDIEDGYEVCYQKGGVKTDIFFVYKKDDMWYNSACANFNGDICYKYNYFLHPYKSKEIEWFNYKFLVPDNIELFLENAYGKDYMTPNPNYDYHRDANNIIMTTAEKSNRKLSKEQYFKIISTPKLSVIIPLHNYDRYIETALLSVMSQKINFNIEILISNDKSTDNSLDIVKRFKNFYENEQFKFIIYDQKENLGEIENTHFLIRKSSGDYIAYLDADDYWINPNKLQIQVDFLEENKEYSLTCMGYYRQFKDMIEYPLGTSWRCPLDQEIDSIKLLNFNLVGSASSRVFRNYPDLCKEYYKEFFSSDWPLNFELSLRGKVKYINIPSYVYRIHGNSMSDHASKNEEQNKDLYNEKRISLLKNRLIEWIHS